MPTPHLLTNKLPQFRVIDIKSKLSSLKSVLELQKMEIEDQIGIETDYIHHLKLQLKELREANEKIREAHLKNIELDTSRARSRSHSVLSKRKETQKLLESKPKTTGFNILTQGAHIEKQAVVPIGLGQVKNPLVSEGENYKNIDFFPGYKTKQTILNLKMGKAAEGLPNNENSGFIKSFVQETELRSSLPVLDQYIQFKGPHEQFKNVQIDSFRPSPNKSQQQDVKQVSQSSESDGNIIKMERVFSQFDEQGQSDSQASNQLNEQAQLGNQMNRSENNLISAQQQRFQSDGDAELRLSHDTFSKPRLSSRVQIQQRKQNSQNSGNNTVENDGSVAKNQGNFVELHQKNEIGELQNADKISNISPRPDNTSNGRISPNVFQIESKNNSPTVPQYNLEQKQNLQTQHDKGNQQKVQNNALSSKQQNSTVRSNSNYHTNPNNHRNQFERARTFTTANREPELNQNLASSVEIQQHRPKTVPNVANEQNQNTFVEISPESSMKSHPDLSMPPVMMVTPRFTEGSYSRQKDHVQVEMRHTAPITYRPPKLDFLDDNEQGEIDILPIGDTSQN